MTTTGQLTQSESREQQHLQTVVYDMDITWRTVNQTTSELCWRPSSFNDQAPAATPQSPRSQGSNFTLVSSRVTPETFSYMKSMWISLFSISRHTRSSSTPAHPLNGPWPLRLLWKGCSACYQCLCSRRSPYIGHILNVHNECNLENCVSFFSDTRKTVSAREQPKLSLDLRERNW